MFDNFIEPNRVLNLFWQKFTASIFYVVEKQNSDGEQELKFFLSFVLK